MALELRQQLKLSQQLVMTPQLQQAIKLLQLSRLELVETVNQELMENPFLEEGFDEPEPNLDSEGREPVAQNDVVREMPGDENALRREADWDNYLGDFASASRQSQVREYEALEEGQGFEARLTGKHSLDGHLAWQIRLSDFTEQEMEIAEHILGNLDSSGYLASPVEEIAEITQSGVEDVERVLKRVQRFDPLGVAARDPRECLLVQVEALGYDDPVLVSLISEHLEDLEKKRYKPLARKFKLTLEELKEYLDIIQTLDPMPGSSFGTSEPVYVSPDAYVYKFEDEFVILLNEEGLPRLQLNSMYMDCLQGAKCKEKDYFQEKMRSAVWLMKSLYQRQRTLFKVLESIVKFQRDFFEEGVKHLKPLILKDVADDIGMHESTVSRITTNKYVATPHGTFELKFFFNSALTLDDGSEVGSESVKALIKQLIGEEDSHQPLSDEKIVDILKDKLQVNIARRTVAKYRTALNIPSSSKRKEIF
ncbi:RNA polymerase, sigma 54 subunit, RpoN [Alkalidesulfovibrio alkalitolerans DSM 16529]|uniref:RNA polymerase, sigma 54 subunit, RpoN n=1 Tax=Alkalidesulfovibrio alkalitolerans DSM 16529 TaxID=1121439 RepID=S7UEM9_9BACT|nr:RNA polymerase factor sigma-54 [Alkalidesulfovibrio alkalitolerans]EPR30698.1 RNA polymerase, sigma 54 subunit, RpoN [Alkalidesulfovibrio alkalitolerans DSM 16529]